MVPNIIPNLCSKYLSRSNVVMQEINCAPNADFVILAKDFLYLKAQNGRLLRLELEKYHDILEKQEL